MAKAAATAHPRRNKAEVQQEFVKIREEAAATREGRNAKVEEAAKLREAEVRQAVDGLSVEGVAQSISALSVQISKALAEHDHRNGVVGQIASSSGFADQRTAIWGRHNGSLEVAPVEPGVIKESFVRSSTSFRIRCGTSSD